MKAIFRQLAPDAWKEVDLPFVPTKDMVFYPGSYHPDDTWENSYEGRHVHQMYWDMQLSAWVIWLEADEFSSPEDAEEYYRAMGWNLSREVQSGC